MRTLDYKDIYEDIDYEDIDDEDLRSGRLGQD